MPFPWVAATSAAIGIGSSLFGASSREQQRKADNKARKEQWKGQRDAAQMAVRVQDEQNILNWTWKMAETEALRFQDKQQKADYEFKQSRLTDAALTNLKINEQAIFDQYSTAEDLRMTQEEMNLAFETGQLGLEANDAARRYMTAIRDNNLQAQQYAMQQNRQVETLIRNQVLDSQMETLQRDIQFAASIAERGQQKARALSRGASASTAKSLQQNSAKALGRSYGELLVKQQQRRGSLATMNATMQGETAKGLARFALASGQALNDLKSSNANYRMKGDYALDKFSKLTIPGFDLAARQGQRELDSLFVRTQGQLDEASMPYRESIIFDPQKPLPGLYPVIAQPTYQAKESTASVIGGAIGAGIQGAMKGTYAKEGGGIGWF